VKEEKSSELQTNQYKQAPPTLFNFEKERRRREGEKSKKKKRMKSDEERE